jgi:hypothetical protein
MRDRPVDPSALVDDETPGDIDADAVTERWEEIEERGHPIPENEDDAGE